MIFLYPHSQGISEYEGDWDKINQCISDVQGLFKRVISVNKIAVWKPLKFSVHIPSPIFPCVCYPKEMHSLK